MLKAISLGFVLVSAAISHADYNPAESLPELVNTGIFGPTYVCSAQDDLGKRYLSTGRNPQRVQDDAAEECLRHNENCYRTGCTVARRGD